ncbi:hypothetical protein AAMO2058_001634000 [Amorphochlora amoebiformis]
MSRGRSRIARSKEFRAFRAQIPKRRCNVQGKDWTYYQYGPQEMVPVICLHGTSGTAETFFCQVMSLGSKGYHVISAQWADYWEHGKWVDGFYRFLAAINVTKCHIFGVSLGGYMALHFAGRYPERVSSLILCNSFVDTKPFHQSPTWTTMLGYMPDFYLKKYILESFPKGEMPATHADAVDFVVEQLETLTRRDLGSRLTLNCLKSSTDRFIDKIKKLPVTILDTVDDVVLPEQMRDRLYKTFTNAKLAYIKHGGDFPFLSSNLEVTMHIQVHLRNLQVFPGGLDVKAYADKTGIQIQKEENISVEMKKSRTMTKEEKERERRRVEKMRREEEIRKKEEERKRQEELEIRRKKEAARRLRQAQGNKILAGLVEKDDDADDFLEPKPKAGKGLHNQPTDLFAESGGEADPFS